MQKIILSLSNDEYVSEETIKTSIWYLINFFQNISINYINFYIDWSLNQDEIEQYAGNTSYLIKKNNKIYIGFIYSEDAGDSSFYNISIPEFINTLKQWEKVLDLKAKKIMITEENGIITIEPE